MQPPASFNGSNLFGMIRVDTVNPAYFTPIDSIWKLRSGANWKELDFDGPDSFPEVPALEDKIRKFFNLPEPDDSETVYRKATRLHDPPALLVRDARAVRQLDHLHAPGTPPTPRWRCTAASTGPPWSKANLLNRNANLDALAGKAKGIAHERGYNTVYAPEMWVLWGLATGSIPLVSDLVGKRYFLPLTATYTMRMQSNFHRKWILHLNPDWGL